MRKNIKRLLSILTYLLITTNLTSCWSSMELNKIAIVIGIGIDKSSKQDDVSVTTQIGVPSLNQSASDIRSNEQFVNYKEKGRTIGEAVKNISKELNRVLFYAHNQVVIFSEDLAYQGIKEELDFFLRNRESRPLTWILISEGDASNILEVKPKIQDTPGINIGKLIKNEKIVSQLPSVDLKDFVSKLMSKTTSPIVPIVKLKKIGSNGDKIPYISETAVFKKDKMVGKLNEAESFGLLWGINKVRFGTIIVNSPSGSDNISIRINRAKSKIKPEVKDNEIIMNITITADGDILEQTTSEDLANPKAFKVIENIENEFVKNQVMMAWSKAKELNADMFGFGDMVYKYHPKHWKKIDGKWDDEFQKIRVNVIVDTRLRRMGKITKPATFEGK